MCIGSDLRLGSYMIKFHYEKNINLVMFDFTSPKLGVVASSGNVVVALMVSVAESVLLMPKSALQQCCSIS